MKAQELRLDELVDFREGQIVLQGRRLVLHSLHAVAQFRSDLIEMFGPDDARRVLTRFGYFWGQADAAAMKRTFDWDSTEEWLKACPRMHTLQGVTRAVARRVSLDEEARRLEMAVTWRDSGEAEEHLFKFGRSQVPVCWMLVGYASGYASFVLGAPVFFREQKCVAMGDAICTAVGRDEASWGDELGREKEFFEAGDIRGKVRDLTRELRKRTKQLVAQRRRLAELERAETPGFVEAHSKAFQKVLELSQRVADFDTSVLITGESGVGKEVLARRIHQLSHRAEGPFVAVNCSALPETLLESELFGHKAGAFTGAISDRVGLFEQAAKGTIFLDEVGDISAKMQMQLLRVLQEREIMRVGESTTRKIDVRVIAATNQRLEDLVERGEFREDLLYRLRVIEINVPPLRDRREDILPLARYFVKRFAERFDMPDLRLDARCVNALLAYPWPGNIRELENAIERAVVLSRESVILPESLPERVTRGGGRLADVLTSTDASLEEVQNAHLLRILEAVGGNRTRAADILGISPATLWRKLKKLNVES